MTEPRILADRLVERTFGKKRAAPVTSEEKKPQPPQLVTLQIEDARKNRLRRQQLIEKFKEF